MNKPVDDLIQDYLLEQTTKDEERWLSDWVRQSPENARTFAKAALMHGQIRALLSGEKQAHDSGAMAVPVVSVDSGDRNSRLGVRRSQRMNAVVTATVALFAIVGMTFLFWNNNLNRNGQIAENTAGIEIVLVAASEDVVWQGEERKFNTPFQSDRLELKQGIVTLRLPQGVEVTLQGPADYELMDEDSTLLHSGLLAASVPPGAEGFRVETPTLEVIDLGTEFGIELDANGKATVSVFDGEVKVGLKDQKTKKLLKEGEAIQWDQKGAIEPTDFNPTPYQRIWPVSSGIEQSEGAFRLLLPWERRLRLLRSNDEIFIAPERPKTFADSLTVNISEAGDYSHNDDLTPATLESGELIRSYIFFFRPDKDDVPPREKRINGTITFQNPILGMIVKERELTDSAGQFYRSRAGDALRNRELEFFSDPRGDRISLSEDRRTLSVSLGGVSPDIIRVVVSTGGSQHASAE